jgi:hypothetical protein
METGIERLESGIPFLHNVWVTSETLTEIMERIVNGVDGVVVGG